MAEAPAHYSENRLVHFVDAPEVGPGYRRDPLTQEVYYSAAWLSEADKLALVPPPELDTHERPGKFRGPADPEAAAQVQRDRELLRNDIAEGRRHGTGPWPPTEMQEALARGIAANSIKQAAKNVGKLLGHKPQDADFLKMVEGALEVAAKEVADGGPA